MDQEFLKLVFTVAAIVLVLGLFAALLYFILRAYRGIGDLDKETAEAEASFEQEALEELEAVGGVAPPATPPVPVPPQDFSAAGASPPVPAPPPPPAPPTEPRAPAAAAAAAGPSDKPEDVEELAKRLYKLRIVTDLEGRIPMPMPPDGLIYRMRSGQTCGILPRLENEATMLHQCRRFDMVFTLAPGGEVLVVQRLQTRLPELIDSPTDYGKS